MPAIPYQVTAILYLRVHGPCVAAAVLTHLKRGRHFRLYVTMVAFDRDFRKEDFAMAETSKLSVGQALDKLRGTEPPQGKMARLDEEIARLNQEAHRLRATRHLVERGQRTVSAEGGATGTKTGRVSKLKISGVMIAISIAIAVSAWACWLFWKG
jgi:hypothetical protein